MPRKLRVQKLRRRTVCELTVPIRCVLEGGYVFDCFWPGQVAPTRETLKELWETFRDTILPTWITSKPRTRPYAWWMFDSPEPRRRNLVGFEPSDKPEDAFHSEPGYYETEREYLARHAMLTVEELGNV
jgi:hypothetical protein